MGAGHSGGQRRQSPTGGFTFFGEQMAITPDESQRMPWTYQGAAGSTIGSIRYANYSCCGNGADGIAVALCESRISSAEVRTLSKKIKPT